MIGAELVAKSAADGYTLYVMPGTHVLLPYLVQKVPFNTMDDFTPMAMIGSFEYFFVSHPGQPFASLKGMIEYARTNPGKLSVAVSDVVSGGNQTGVSDLDPKPRVTLVTGAARGLGLAIAERLGAEGHRLILCDADVDAVQRTAAQLRSRGLECDAIGLDVSHAEAVTSAFAQVHALHGRLDILINNAGVQGLLEGRRPRVEEMPVDLWQRTLDVNLTGAFLMCRGSIPLMKAGRWGRIVNIASRAARMRTGIGNADYAASKAGLLGFSRVLAGEVGGDGITVNCIAPSRIETEMTRTAENSGALVAANIRDTVVGRLCETNDVAASVAFLCSDEASFVTRAILDVNGGSFMA